MKKGLRFGLPVLSCKYVFSLFRCLNVSCDKVDTGGGTREAFNTTDSVYSQ